MHTSTSEASAEKEVSKSVVIGRVFKSLNGQKSVAAGTPPWTPLGELTALRDPIAGQMGCDRRENGGERTREREEEQGRRG